MLKQIQKWLRTPVEEKTFPSQEYVSLSEGHFISSPFNTDNYRNFYERLEIVNRVINMIIDDCAAINYKVGNSLDIKYKPQPVKPAKKVGIYRLLNHEPNPFQDINSFRRSLFQDLLLDGNIFIYMDQVPHQYRLPANKTTIIADDKLYIDHFEFGNSKYEFDEVIHIKDNGIRSSYRGSSRMQSVHATMKRLSSMVAFQDNFFTNGAVPGLVLKTPHSLSDRVKTRMRESWLREYRPGSGGRNPMILDGGMEIDSISNTNFREMDFENSVTTVENAIAKGLGVPPVLLNSGNNANIRPNLRIYYLQTILPIINKYTAAMSRYTGLDIKPDLTKVPAMQPELKELASYTSTLVNGGIISANEGREELGYPSSDEEHMSEIRLPANIVGGSAVDPSQGGRPEGDDGE